MRTSYLNKKILSSLLVFLYIFLIFGSSYAGAAEPAVYEAGSLAQLEDTIFEAIRNRVTYFKITYTGNTENIMNDVRTARDNAVGRDPYDEGCISLISGFKVSNFADHADISFDSFQYYTDKEQEQFVDGKVQGIVDRVIRNGMNDLDKEKALHDYIIENIDYDNTLAGYTAYSGLKNGKTVCNGYVQLVYRLFNLAGIETRIVKGTLERDGTSKDHAWNLVKLNGKWYHLDVTLNDTLAGELGTNYGYFNLSDAAILADHTFDQQAYPSAPDSYPLPANPDGSSPSSSGSFNISQLLSERLNGQQVVATVDGARFFEVVDDADRAQKVYELNLNSKALGYKVELPLEIMDKLAEKNSQALLRFKTSVGWLDLPATALNTADIAGHFKTTARNIKLNVIIEKLPDSDVEAVLGAIRKLGASAAESPVRFELQAEYNGQQRDISSVNKYLTGYILLDQSAGQQHVLGLFYNPEKRDVIPLPTAVESIDGSLTAGMKHRGGGIYITAQGAAKTFKDLQGHWAQQNVEQLASRLIISGKDIEKFDPQGRVTRAEFAAMLVRALGLKESGTSRVFSDISGKWYEQPVETAAEVGLISGYSDGKFRPNAPVSRQEMAVMVSKALALTELQVQEASAESLLTKFSDYPAMGQWARTSAAAVVNAKIINGDNKGRFMPLAYTTRAEAATVLLRTLKYMKFIN